MLSRQHDGDSEVLGEPEPIHDEYFNKKNNGMIVYLRI